MSQRRTFSILFYLQLLFLVTQAKSISLDFFFRSYINSEHKDKAGKCCTRGRENCIEDCTSRVKFCLQSVGNETSCPHGELSFTIFSDNLTFSADGQIGTSKSNGNISNPVSFQVNPGPYQISVLVSNAMSNSTILSFVKRVETLTSEVGIMNETIWTPDHKFQYSYRIRCALTYYGPDCSRFCAPVDDSTGHFKCDANGEKECLSGYTNSSESDQRCTKCIPGSQTGTCRERDPTTGSTSGVSAGGVAGILVPLLLILACILGGITTGLLWKFKPCTIKTPIKAKNQEALNNPIYGCKAADKTALNNPIYGENNDNAHNYAEAQSNPLYSSQDNFERSTAGMIPSLVVENEFLMDILQPESGDVRHTFSASLEEGEDVVEETSHVPRMDPYLSYKDDFLSVIADAGLHQ